MGRMVETWAAGIVMLAVMIGVLAWPAAGEASPSSPATVPVITKAPIPQTVDSGQKATFSVVATGSPAPTYQWRLNSVPIGGATSASYTMTTAATAANDGDLYDVVVTNSAGSVTSAQARLTVHFAPSVTTQPAPQTVALGATATFTVVGTGNPAPTYQWQRLTPPATWTNVGATTASYTTKATVPTDDQAQFRVVLTNSVSSATSSPALLTVDFAPMIQQQPADQSVTVGFPVTFSVTAIGTGTLTYQWQRQTPPATTWTNLGAATASSTYTFTPSSISADSGSLFRVTVTNAQGSVTSQFAILTVTPPVAPSITAQPISIAVAVGHPATFTVVATGTPILQYQWFRGAAAISGATGASYTIPAAVSGDSGASFTVVVTNTVGSVTSNVAVLTVDPGSNRLPSQWADGDVGTVGSPGDATLTGTTFTVCGAGAGISGTADAFNYMFQGVTGDASITALVTPACAHAGALAGVLIRESLAPGSAFAGMFITGSGGTLFEARTGTGAAAGLTPGPAGALPTWVRLDRTGNVLTGSVSADGTTWTTVATETVTMAPSVVIGFASTSGDAGILNCSTFASFSGTGPWDSALRTSGGGGGGGGCGLLGLEGVLVLVLLGATRRLPLHPSR